MLLCFLVSTHISTFTPPYHGNKTWFSALAISPDRKIDEKMDRRARANLPTPSGWGGANYGREPEAIKDDSGTSLLLPLP
jgi:hypothetical protein